MAASGADGNVVTLPVGDTFIKLEAALKWAGFCETGGQAKVCIQQGEATLNGETCFQRGKKCKAGDVIGMGGKIIRLVDGADGAGLPPAGRPGGRG